MMPRLKRPLAWLLRTARALHEDEGGAALVFACITLFSLALLCMFVFQIGLVSSDRMQIQQAADAAAYSGAQVEANALNSIGEINDGMAYVHYTTLRYVVDSIVYGTLEEYKHHKAFVRRRGGMLLGQTVMPPTGAAPPGIPTESGPGIENRDAYDWVMLGDEDAWKDRWERVERFRSEQVVEKGKTWLQDLHTAGRLIMAVTPRLVREKAAEVAAMNGAEFIGLSSDLEKAFKTTGDGAGFSEHSGRGPARDDRASDSTVFRYANRRLEVDGRPRGFPSWFDAPAGKAIGEGYSQIRLCWNRNDWAHRDTQGEFHMNFPRMFMGAPNGHWHAKHTHYYFEPDPVTGYYTIGPIPLVHGGLTDQGGSVAEDAGSHGGGHYLPTDDDPTVHEKVIEQGNGMDPLLFGPTGAHHAAIKCPTCMVSEYTSGGQPLDKTSFWSEVKKGQRDVQNKTGFELTFSGQIPKPLTMEAPLLRSGVTVVAWRASHGIGDILPASEWGMIAVASAQVGYWTDRGISGLRQLDQNQADYGGGARVPLDDDSTYRNLFFSKDDSKGVAFGARLVPIARELTWHPDLANGSGLDALLQGKNGWWVASESREEQRAGQPPELRALRSWVACPDWNAVREAFWH